MKTGPRPEQTTSSEELTPEQEATAKAASTWVHHLARTLKTCRLYDAQNPTVVKFRQELSSALRKLVEEHGTLVLTFTADDVLCEGASLYPAKSRDDNLALAFFRDGIRTLTITPGFEQRELDLLLDCVLQVTSQSEDDDLVTLLWQVHLPHVTIDYVPGEADVGAAMGDPNSNEGAVPWPTPAATTEADQPAGAAVAAPALTEAAADGSRSDDWAVGHITLQVEADLEELETLASSEVQRFKQEFEAESQVTPTALAIGIARVCLGTESDPEELLDWARFLPRVLRHALEQGRWAEARESLGLLEACNSPEWSKESLAQELLQPISVAGFTERLEPQDAEGVAAFIGFARALEERGVEVLAQALAEIQNPRHQRQISEALVESCRSNPEILGPWLSDRRWQVVRKIIQILGAIGGREIAGMLGALVEHPDARIRQELVGALRAVEPQHAKPVLVRLLDGADTRLFCGVLSQLGQQPDPAIAELLLGYLGDPAFDQRPAEEQRAVYKALSTVGGDAVLPQLEVELHKGNWFARNLEARRQDVARCIARIGTPQAKALLERGVESKRAAVRKACEGALTRFDRRE